MNENVRYEPEEVPPRLVVLGAGAQAAALIVAPVVLTVAIVVRAAGAALVVCGLTTALQAARVGRFGSGHILMMGTSGAFIAVSVAALKLAGPSTLATLVVISSLFQFLLAARLSLLRRIFTPTVAGVVIMLIAATVTPVIFDSLTQVLEGTGKAAAPIAAGTTLLVVVGLILRGSPSMRIWSPVLGIVAGCALSVPFGMYDASIVRDARWFGVPFGEWPGFDLTPDAAFWALLPAFVVVTLGSHRDDRGWRGDPEGVPTQPTGYGLSGGPGRSQCGRCGKPALGTGGYSSEHDLLNQHLAGGGDGHWRTASWRRHRRHDLHTGLLPKVSALLIAIPSPEAASYITVLLALLFVQGMRIVVQYGVDHRKAVVAGLSFWMGVGFQNGWIFQDILGDEFLAILMGNGMTSRSIVAVTMMLFLELTGPRRKRLRVALDEETLPKVSGFLREFAMSAGWSASAAERLVLVGEETLSSMSSGEQDMPSGRRLVATARSVGREAEVEFIAAAGGENLEDRLAYLGDSPDVTDEREISFRLLRHLSTSVSHQKYHGVEVVSVRVAADHGGEDADAPS